MTSKLYYFYMNTTKKPAESISEIKRRRTMFRNAILVMALLFIALVVGSGSTTTDSGPSGRDIAWGILTVVAFGSMLWAQYVAYKQADEFQKLVQLKAAAISFMVVLFATVVAQMLHALTIISLDKTIQIVIISGVLAWMALLKLFERRHY
jgi:hypothetical protein